MEQAGERRGRSFGIRARSLVHGSVPARSRVLLVLCVVATLFAGMVSASSAAPKDKDNGKGPKGNNGTVKVDGGSFPDDFKPNNDPHVGCAFNIEFFNYDPGVTARATFELHPPTTSDLFDAGSLTRSATLNSDGEGQLNVTLPGSFFAGADPQEQQGFHVKLTTNAPHSKGADTKHKVFWVKCAQAAPPSVKPPSVTPPSVKPPTVPPTTRPPTEVRGRRFPRPGRVKALAVTGVSLGKLGLAGAGFLAAGLAMLIMSVRRRPVLAVVGAGRNRWPSSRQVMWRPREPVPLLFRWRGPPRLPPSG